METLHTHNPNRREEPIGESVETDEMQSRITGMSRRRFLTILGGSILCCGLGGVRTAEAAAESIYEVDIPRLRETVRKNGVLALTHNGESEMENEFWRVAGNEALGPIVNHVGGKNPKRYKAAKKQCHLKIITGVDNAGQDIIKDIGTIDWTVVDATGGKLSKEANGLIGNRKFGLILCAGHVYDISKLATLSSSLCSKESLLLLGGCNTASMIPDLYRPNRLVAGAEVGIGTETFTHLTKVTAASLIGKQFTTWEEYFRNLQQNYSYELQRNPECYVFPGNPIYREYTRHR